GLDGLSLVGRARDADGAVSLTRKSPGSMAGAVWTSEEVPVTEGFEVQFVFEIDHISWFTIGDGMAFVIQDVGPDAIGGGASGNGYSGIGASVAVEFDTVVHTYEGEGKGVMPEADTPVPLTNHVAVHTMGSGANSAGSRARVDFVGLQDVRLYDRMRHLALVRYEPGALSVFVDDMELPVLEVEVDLADVLGRGDPTAWIGFTAGTEPGFYSDFLIHGWTFDPLT
ncbi:MAG: L-type lectin-domain containing protein, partial [Halobacteriales archaeon]|nr:L-type lectin-domain containing protein [Halobacteriales archaeon]